MKIASIVNKKNGAVWPCFFISLAVFAVINFIKVPAAYGFVIVGPQCELVARPNDLAGVVKAQMMAGQFHTSRHLTVRFHAV